MEGLGLMMHTVNPSFWNKIRILITSLIGFNKIWLSIFDFILDTDFILEWQRMQNLISINELIACRYTGFRKYMDTTKDKNDLKNLSKLSFLAKVNV